jgi:malonyl-CoA O-methyltransferase
MTIDLDALTALPGIKSNERCLIVEGAGGVLVPVTESSTMVDLMVRLGFPVLIAARTSLGTINHTLLTIEALRARDLQVAGVALIGNPEPGARRSIEQYGRVSVIIDMPMLDPLTSKVLESWVSSAFDPDGVLRQWLK